MPLNISRSNHPTPSTALTAIDASPDLPARPVSRRDPADGRPARKAATGTRPVGARAKIAPKPDTLELKSAPLEITPGNSLREGQPAPRQADGNPYDTLRYVRPGTGEGARVIGKMRANGRFEVYDQATHRPTGALHVCGETGGGQVGIDHKPVAGGAPGLMQAGDFVNAYGRVIALSGEIRTDHGVAGLQPGMYVDADGTLRRPDGRSVRTRGASQPGPSASYPQEDYGYPSQAGGSSSQWFQDSSSVDPPGAAGSSRSGRTSLSARQAPFDPFQDSLSFERIGTGQARNGIAVHLPWYHPHPVRGDIGSVSDLQRMLDSGLASLRQLLGYRPAHVFGENVAPGAAQAANWSPQGHGSWQVARTLAPIFERLERGDRIRDITRVIQRTPEFRAIVHHNPSELYFCHAQACGQNVTLHPDTSEQMLSQGREIMARMQREDIPARDMMARQEDREAYLAAQIRALGPDAGIVMFTYGGWHRFANVFTGRDQPAVYRFLAVQ